MIRSTINLCLALAAGFVLCVSVAGCHGDSGPSSADINPVDHGDTGLTPQQRLDALKANTSMPENLKARKIRMLENQIAGKMGGPPGAQARGMGQ